MKIDILMATYNGEKYIEEQLDSIIDQTHRNWYLLIRDDDSTDNTVEIINRYIKMDNRIKLIKDNKSNLGITKNFEELLNYSSSDYIMFSDQDDIWFVDKIEKIYSVMKKNEINNTFILVHSDSLIYSKDKVIRNFIGKKANKSGIENFFFEYVVQGSSMMINKKLKNLALPFFDEVSIHDRYFHLLSELLGLRIYIEEPLSKYRQHESNQIGAKKNIYYNIFHKKYYNIKDKALIKKIFIKHRNKIKEKDVKLIFSYLKITNSKTNRLKKIFLIKKNNIFISFKKILSLIIKG